MKNTAAIQAERAVLGSVIAGYADPIGLHLSQEDFYEPPHQRLWATILERSKGGRPVDAIILQREFEGDTGLADLGGAASYIPGLLVEALEPAPLFEYARIIREESQKRWRCTQLQLAQGAIEANDEEASQAALDALTKSRPKVGGLPSHWTLVGPGGSADAIASPSWLIKSLLGQGDLGLLFGPSGCGKSFLAMDIAFAVALGQPWRGLRCKKGAVLYVAAEGARGVRLRRLALESNFNTHSAPLYVLDAAPVLSQRDDVDNILAAIREVESDSGCRVVMVVIDTLARTMPGANENSFEDMGVAIGALNRIQREAGASVLAVHHTGKDSGRGPRCIVEAIEASGAAANANSLPSGAADIALSALKAELEDRGRYLTESEGVPPDVRVVPIKAWRDRARAMGISSGHTDDAVYRAFNRAQKRLIDDKLVHTADDFAWLSAQFN